jgi:hypothetical protein
VDSVRAHCMPWLLDPFSFLQGCSGSRRDAVCSVIAAFVLLVGACVADDAVPAGWCVLASGLLRRSVSALALPPAPRVAVRCPLPFLFEKRPTQRMQQRLGRVVVYTMRSIVVSAETRTRFSIS